MTTSGLLFKNAFRNRFRTLLTIVGMAIAVLGFLFLRTVVSVWNSGVNSAAEDRLVSRHKVSLTMDLPRTYFQKVQDQVKGIDAISYANWFGAVYPKDERAFFANFAVDGDTYLTVYPEVTVPPDQMKAWKEDRAGAIVGDVIAKKYDWKIGDKVTLQGTIYPGDWEFTIRGYYATTSKQFDRSSFFFHWQYMNDAMPPNRQERIGWLAIRVKDATQGPAVSHAIDKLFESSDAETLTESERAFNLSFLSMYGGIFTAMNVVSIVILVIMAMIVGNTIAMGVRERTHEYGVLRAVGFVPGQLGKMVVGETMIIAVIGGVLGIALAYPLVNGFGRFVEDNMGNFFPYFRVEPKDIVLAGGLALVVGGVSALLPALTVMRLEVTTALRRLG